MRIDKQLKQLAIRVVREAAAQSEDVHAAPAWTEKFEQRSQLCAEGVSSTHIAFLGTAILAKAVDRRADLFAIKPKHAPGNPNAFSARSLCHSVLVPLAVELGFSIGVTGREPLNNQPYFRMTRLDDGTPVHPGARRSFDYMVEVVRELNDVQEAEAQAALRAFIAVRRRYELRYFDVEDEVQAQAALRPFTPVGRSYQPRYPWRQGDFEITPDRLADVIAQFVEEDSEGGRRAQAVVAGLMDLFAGTDRVETGRINDPSRKYPGDVCVRAAADAAVFEKAIEVRDKPVAVSDVQIFARKCIKMDVQEAALVIVSTRQELLDQAALTAWANELGIGLTIFRGWPDFVDQALFWSQLPKPIAACQAVASIRKRLIGVEARPEAVTLWQNLTQS